MPITILKEQNKKRDITNMGMAASQARLLMITARMHDIEYQAQTIQNAKIQLATQSDQVYQKYLEALDATTLTRTDMNGNPITASFNNISGLGSINFNSGLNNKYAIRDNTHGGYLVVDSQVKSAYDNYDGYDPYEFALYAMDIETVDPNSIEEDEEKIYEAHKDEKSENCKAMADIKERMEELAGVDGENYNDLTEDEMDEYDELEAAWRFRLYKQFAAEIYAEHTDSGEEGIEGFDNNTFKYYASIFKQIQEAGGCVSINEYDGPSGDANTNSDWLKTMIQSGNFSMYLVNEDQKNGEVTFSGSGVNSDSEINYTTTSTIDKAALAKAEAEYEHDTKKINQKDKQYDMDLSKLETERTALKTQSESIKNIVKENVERTFGIFS